MSAPAAKATHTDYMHPKLLRVVDGGQYTGWSKGSGWYTGDACCMAPSHSQYSKLSKPSLPGWSKS